MHRQTAALALTLVLAAQSVGAAPAWTLGPDGFGPFRIGMSFDQARRIAGPRLQATAPGLLASQACDQLALPGHRGVALMFVDGTLRRIDVFKRGIRTSRGIAPGDPVRRAQRAYPGLLSEPNKYNERERYLSTRPAHGRALRFETRAGRIDRIYAGDWPQVQYTEGCL